MTFDTGRGIAHELISTSSSTSTTSEFFDWMEDAIRRPMSPGTRKVHCKRGAEDFFVKPNDRLVDELCHVTGMFSEIYYDDSYEEAEKKKDKFRRTETELFYNIVYRIATVKDSVAQRSTCVLM